MKKLNYSHVEELLDDPTFLMYCTGKQGPEKEYWEQRISGDANLEELALLAKQTYWSLQLGHPDNLLTEVQNFRRLREQTTAQNATEIKIGGRKARIDIIRQGKWVAVAAAILIVGIMVVATLNHTPAARIQMTNVGEVRQVTLPDGSLMYLNGNTEVSYIEKGFGENRTIMLARGEAFFEVEPGFESTFTVLTSRGLKVEDISTAFGVRSLQDLPHETVQVQEGLVRFYDPAAQHIQLLPEGEAIRYDHQTGQVSKARADALSASGWITGQYAVFDVTLLEFSKILSSVYDIEIQFNDAATKDKRISTLFNKNQEVGDILRNLQTIYELKIEIDGNKVQI